MFRSKIVFVVGAGASKELGLPIGSELTDLVGKKLDFSFDGFQQTSGSRCIVEAYKGAFPDRNGVDSINARITAGRKISEGIPLAASIDNFLHTHSRDPLVVEVGKVAIAECILEAERRSSIFLDAQREYIDFRSLKRSWHTEFVKILFEGRGVDEVNDIFDNVGFICFNYDRCIEHYMVHALQSYMRLDQSAAESAVGRMAIVHPYGQVGSLPWQRLGQTSAFGAIPRPNNILNIAAQLRTFTERVDDKSLLEKMRVMLYEAEKVIYIGFSFGSMNLELMKLPQVDGRKYILGTALNISKPNQQVIIDNILECYPGLDMLSSYPILSDESCLGIFESFGRAIS